MKVHYTSTGLVFGNYWGGGKGAYPSVKLSGDTKEEIIEQAVSGLDGSLDGGMGFESLIGAVLFIVKNTTVEIEGKEFTNEEYFSEFIGNLSDEEKLFLAECTQSE